MHFRMLKHIAAFFIFCLATLYITFPLLSHLGEYTTGLGDELVIAWIQNWVIHAVTSGNLFSIFNANLYYPFQNSLAFSDTFFTSSIISLIPRVIVGEPIVVNNVTLILSLTFLGFALYLLAYYITRSFPPSLLAGILVIFSPAVLSNTTHLQMLAIVGVPLSILFFLLFINKQKSLYLLISLTFFLLQVYNSFLPGYFIVISCLIIFIVFWFQNRKKARKIISKNNILLTALASLLLLPIVIPYYQVSKEFNYVRDIRDAIHFAIQPEDLLYPGSTSRLEPFLLNAVPTNKYSQNNEFKPGYLGFVFSFLSIVTLIYILKNRKKNDSNIIMFSIIAATGFVLSLGPFLHLFRQTIHEPFPIPLPYILFYYLAPGFQGFRNSARWEMLFILAFAIVIAIVLQKMLKKYSHRTRVLIYCVLIIGAVAEFNFPIHTNKVPHVKDFPKVYSWLNTTPQDTAIIEMPIYNWGMWPYTQQELWREYYGTVHFRKTVNGYTGFSPPPWQDLVNKLYKEFPEKDTVKVIKNLKIDYIIVDKTQYNKLYKAKESKLDGEHIVQILKKNTLLEFVEQFNNQAVFKVK